MKNERPYSEVSCDQLILRDLLAADRTDLANERTLLAYVRTGLTLIVVGITFIHIVKTAFAVAIGWAFIPMGLVILAVGSYRYYRMHKRIMAIKDAVPPDGR